MTRSGDYAHTANISTPNNLITLRNLHLATGAKKTMEVGFGCAGSGLVFMQTHKDLGTLPQRQHLAIDPYQRAPWLDQIGLVAVEHAGLTEYLDLREEVSSLVLPNLVMAKARYDLAYIDGSHLFEDVFVDFYFVLRLLADQGIVLFDDCASPHISKVLRFIRANCASSLREFDLTPYRPAGGKSLKYRVARLLGRTQMVAFQKIGEPDRAWDSPFRNF